MPETKPKEYKIIGIVYSVIQNNKGLCTITIEGTQGCQVDTGKLYEEGKQKNIWVNADDKSNALLLDTDKKIEVCNQLAPTVNELFLNQNAGIFTITIEKNTRLVLKEVERRSKN